MTLYDCRLAKQFRRGPVAPQQALANKERALMTIMTIMSKEQGVRDEVTHTF